MLYLHDAIYLLSKLGNMEFHCHAPNDEASRRVHTAKAQKKLIMACGLCLLFIAGEVTGGYLSGSLAIMSDAAHMFSDFASFLISLLAIRLAMRRPSKRFTFGLYRAEVLGALMTIVIIWFVTSILLYLSIHRLVTDDFEVNPDPMIAVATCAVFFNIALGLLLRGQHHGHSHGNKHSHLVEEEINIVNPAADQEHINIRAALIHVLGDLIQSIGVLISSVIIKLWPEYKRADPVCTVLFSIIVFATTIKILKDTLAILLESNTDEDYDAIFNALFNLDHVVKVHDLHIWSLTTDQKLVTVHLAVDASTPSSDKVLQEALQLLRGKFKIHKTTVQVEEYKASVMNDCEQCQFVT